MPRGANRPQAPTPRPAPRGPSGRPRRPAQPPPQTASRRERGPGSSRSFTPPPRPRARWRPPPLAADVIARQQLPGVPPLSGAVRRHDPVVRPPDLELRQRVLVGRGSDGGPALLLEEGVRRPAPGDVEPRRERVRGQHLPVPVL